MESLGSNTQMDTALASVHQNTITSILPHGAGKVSTSGVDGKLVVWDLLALGISKMLL